MTRLIIKRDGEEWEITPVLRFVKRIVHDVPVEGNPTIFGGRTVKILQQKHYKISLGHRVGSKWFDVELVELAESAESAESGDEE